MSLEPDPRTGFSYVHVIPRGWGAYVDIRACYQALARDRPWTRVFSDDEFRYHWMKLKDEPNVLAIVWDINTARWAASLSRRCKLASVYSEAMDEDESKMWKPHLEDWQRFQEIAPQLDATFTHTPWMAQMIARASVRTFVLPVGWDVGAMGEPRDRHPHTFAAFHGSKVGRREMIIPWLEARLNDKRYNPVVLNGCKGFRDLSGSYGRGLLGQLDTSVCSLYIAHSEVRSFSTWRLWQAASTNAALIAEPGDAWPFEPGVHYLEIPRITLENHEQVADLIVELAQSDRAQEVATAAHKLARERFRMHLIEDDYLVPAAKALM